MFLSLHPYTLDTNIEEMALQGAKVWRVNGYIDDCGHIVGDGTEEMGWFNTSTLKEPYRIEGKKTMAGRQRNLDSSKLDSSTPVC